MILTHLVVRITGFTGRHPPPSVHIQIKSIKAKSPHPHPLRSLVLPMSFLSSRPSIANDDNGNDNCTRRTSRRSCRRVRARTGRSSWSERRQGRLECWTSTLTGTLRRSGRTAEAFSLWRWTLATRVTNLPRLPRTAPSGTPLPPPVFWTQSETLPTDA